MKALSIEIFSSFLLNLFSAGSAFLILEKLQLLTTRIAAYDHKADPAALTFLLDERSSLTCRAGQIERAPATRANGVTFFYNPQACWTKVVKWIP